MGQPLPPHIARRLEGILVDAWRDAEHPRSQRRAFIIALGLHGLRAMEVVQLQIRDLNVNASTLRVRTVKGGRDRFVLLDPVFATALHAQVRRRKGPKLPSRSLFITSRGKPLVPAYIHFMTKTTARELGYQFSFHCLRHTAALRLWDATHDILAVMRLLGHRSLSVTHCYLQTFAPIPLDAFPQWRTLRPDISELRLVMPPEAWRRGAKPWQPPPPPTAA